MHIYQPFTLPILIVLLASSRLIAAGLPPELPLWPEGFENSIVYYQDEAVRVNKAGSSSPSGSNRVFNFVSMPTYSILKAVPALK
jgi:hypothetical protein